LGPAVAVMDQPAQRGAATVVDGLFQRIQDEVGAQRGRHAPPDNPPREDVDDEGHVDEAPPPGDVREVGDPKLIWPTSR
jgi:hypothetical protein